MDPLHRTILIILLLLGPTLLWLAIRAFRGPSSRRQREGVFRPGNTGFMEAMPTDEYWVCHQCGSLTRTQWRECYNCHSARMPTEPATAPAAVGVAVALAAPMAITVVSERMPVMASERETQALSHASAQRDTDLAAVAGERLRSRSGERMLRSLEGGLSIRPLGEPAAPRELRPAASLLTTEMPIEPSAMPEPPPAPSPAAPARPTRSRARPRVEENGRDRRAPQFDRYRPETPRPEGRPPVATPPSRARPKVPARSPATAATAVPPRAAPAASVPPAAAAAASILPTGHAASAPPPVTTPNPMLAPEAARCPLFGLQDDVRSFLTMPNPSHRCHATPRPSPIPPEEQSFFCLGGRYRDCGRYVALAAVVSSKPLARH